VADSPKSVHSCHFGELRCAIMAVAQQSLHVSLIAIPDAVISSLTGIYDVMFKMLTGADSAIPGAPPFKVEIVGGKRGMVALASGVPVETHHGIA
jgi:hypothetical protein